MYQDEIKIYELHRMDLIDAVVIEGFPSVGLVSTITANYLISMLELKQIGILDSVYFPTVSVIRDGEPYNPVRIYAGSVAIGQDNTQRMLVVFTSEFQPPSYLIKPIASTILDWMQERKCSLLISPEGLVIEREDESDDSDSQSTEETYPNKDENLPPSPEKKAEAEVRKLEVYGVGSTPKARELLSKYNILEFKDGVISGVAGVLLNEGKRRGFDVISILAEAKQNFPDARASARILEVINEMVLNTKVDVKPLYDEAEVIEAKIKAMKRHADTEEPIPPSPSMYG